MLSDWNPNWKPVAFMVDKSDQEMNAMYNVFEDTLVLLCNFHREQSWGIGGCGKVKMDADHKDRILGFLRGIRKSIEQFKNVTQTLEG